MKLRRCFPPRQLLFLFAVFALTVELSMLPIAARAQDTITMKDGKLQQAKVLGVNGSTVEVRVGSGTVGIPIGNISEVTMPAPPEFAAALAAYEAKDFPKALKSIQSVLDKYKGLPADWAQQAAVMLGDIYVAMNELGRAETAYHDFQKIYPSAGAAQAEVGLARIAVSKKDFAAAKETLEPIAEQALKTRAVPRGLGAAYGQAFDLSGQVKEADGDFVGALEDYLRAVTIFPQDRLAAADAQERADALRKEHAVTVP
jgi:tetratricopeptide (TPR) repeat protein